MLLGITTGPDPAQTATQEKVVPRSIPITWTKISVKLTKHNNNNNRCMYEVKTRAKGQMYNEVKTRAKGQMYV